ncbi:MAG: phospholipase D-like domain-containing protein, partial [Conexivisphaerales archaeon]
MTKIIDNSKEKLATVLAGELSEMKEIAIASAYFNVRGYAALKDVLKDKPLKFLLGKEPNESIKWEEELLKELEEDEDDPEYFKLIQDAVKYFEDSKREVRTPQKEFFHGKAYIGASPNLTYFNSAVGVVGSSNFTYGGLVTNRELNMLNTDREVIIELIKWFNEQWSSSNDFKDRFLDFLKTYVTTRTPYEVVAKALYETYKSRIA